MDNIYVDRTPVEESIRMTEVRDKWRKYVHAMAKPRIKSHKLFIPHECLALRLEYHQDVCLQKKVAGWATS